MANVADISHNLKSSTDGQIFISPLDSNGKVTAKYDSTTEVLSNVIQTRLTGESVQGNVETLESNELKAGRTGSKKKLGNEYSEGSLDIEFSPDSFDDLLAAAFRGKWKDWTSDEASAINPKGTDHVTCSDGELITRWKDGNFNSSEEFTAKTLLGSTGLIKEAEGSSYSVKELTIGTEGWQFDLLKKIGGVTGEDLYQRFERNVVNSFSLDVAINSIVTGSFGLMGGNSPKRVDTDTIKGEDYYGKVDADGKTTVFADDTMTAANFIDNLTTVKPTDTDQFVSTTGNLWINGQNITWGENFSIELNNNIERKNAICVKKAISQKEGKLDITGNYQSYVVKGKSEDVFNAAVDNTTNELMILLQDKEKDPSNMYLFQIFKSSFDAPSSSTSDDYEDTLAWTSFDDKAIRILKIAK